MPNTNLHSEQYLLTKISEGDEGAFTDLFDHYRDGLYSLVWSITGSLQIAEDIVQEVFLKIWLRRTELVNIENFKGYLVVVAKRTIFNELRKTGRLKEREGSFAEDLQMARYDDLVDQLQEKDYQKILHQGMKELSPQQIQVFQLIKLDGLSRDAVADQLGLSPETVKKHLERAMKNLRAYLLTHLDDTTLMILLLLHL